jgi:hypothetical protein
MDFTFDEETGVIIDKATGDRCILIAKARLEQIFLRLTELFQSGAHVIIAESIERYKDGGLGKIELVEFNPEKAELTFRIWNNLFAEMYQDDSTYCFCVEAYVSGIFEQLIGVAPEIHKTKCLGKGDPYCEWNLKPHATGEQDKT